MPLEPGFHELRASLYNLYPRLVHVRLFGAGYLAGIERDAGAARAVDWQKRTGPDGPGRSSLRNEPSSKGMAFIAGSARPPILFLSRTFRSCQVPLSFCCSFVR